MAQAQFEPTWAFIKRPAGYPTGPAVGKLALILQSKGNDKSLYHRFSPYSNYHQGLIDWGDEPYYYIYPDQAKNFPNSLKKYDSHILAPGSGIISSIDTPYDTLVKNSDGNLSFNDHEIWVGNTLVTRLSNQISGVIWYPGSQYLAYQQGDEIRIIEQNGTNDVLLVKLSSSDKSNFIFSWDGSALLYKDGVAYKRAIIK